MVSHLQAELHADIQSVSEAVSELSNDPEPDLQTISDTTASEISAALTMTRRASELRTDLAYTICVCVPSVWQALHAVSSICQRLGSWRTRPVISPGNWPDKCARPPWKEPRIRPPANCEPVCSGSSSPSTRLQSEAVMSRKSDNDESSVNRPIPVPPTCVDWTCPPETPMRRC